MAKETYGGTGFVNCTFEFLNYQRTGNNLKIEGVLMEKKRAIGAEGLTFFFFIHNVTIKHSMMH